MRPTFTAIICLLLAALPLQADEQLPRLKVGAVTYTNVTVTSVSATDIFFTSENGMGNAKLKDLAPALQKQFQFNPAKAAVAEKKQAQNKIQYHEQLLKQPAAHSANDSAPADKVSAGKKIWAKSFLNQKAPEFIVEKWLTAQPNLKGKFVLIDFWATWCPPCRKAIPELNGFQREFNDKLVVIGISDETEAEVKKLTEPKIEYALAIDPQARMKNAVAVTGIPHVLIIDPEGYVRWEGFPFLDGYELNSRTIANIIARYSK